MSCPHCGRWGEACAVTRCEGCGTPQCMGNGLRDGRCKVCLFGHLEGWGRGGFGEPAAMCGYKGCGKPAVYYGVPRVKRCCLDCAPRIKIAVYREIADRPNQRRKETEPLDVHVQRMIVERGARYRRD